MKTATAERPKIMGTTKKVKTSDLESKVKAKASAAPAEGEKKKKKKSKEGKEKGEATQRASNYNFPKDATSAKDRKKFRTTVRKTIAKFKDRLAEAKSGKSKESSKAIIKEMNAYKATVYLHPEEVAEVAD